MRSFASIILLLVMVSFATGLTQWLHMQHHEFEDAQEAAAAVADTPSPSTPQPDHHHHSEEGCSICAQLQAPMMDTSHTVWLIDTGAWVRYVSMLPVSQYSQDVPSSLSCRGPPAPSC